MDGKKRFESLQCLRAVAALLVLWAHIKFALCHEYVSLPAIRTAAGAVGVDVFFIISGFVIALTASKINNSWKLFLMHRIARVVPYYWLITCCYIIIKNTSSLPLLGLNTIFNTLFFLPALDFGQLVTPLHPYGWTLCFEMWFYFAFAFLLYVCKSKAKKLLVGSMGILTLAVSLFYKGSWVLPRFLFSPMVLEFCGGILLYSFYDRLVNKRNALIAAVLCIAAFIGVIHFEYLGWYNKVLDSVRLSWERVLIWGTFSFTLALVFLYLEKWKPALFPRWLKKLGDASYSLYLAQPIILFYAHRISYYENSLLGGAFFIFGTLSISLLLYRFVEKPFTGFVRKQAEKHILKKQPSAH